MQDFVTKWHYSCVMPRQTKLCLGGFRDEGTSNFQAAISFGWGSRPLHTIKKIFPSLISQDYLDIGKMCLEDAEPKNSESLFLASAIRELKKKYPALKLLYTWADAMWGKPGYIYQASNFLYGGFIWTDVYMTAEGKRLHPLQLQAERRARGADTLLRTLAEQKAAGWKHYWGKQFRYVRFLCSADEQEKLLKESPMKWSRMYPKDKDCAWKVQVREGKSSSPGAIAESCEQPSFVSAIKFKG